MKSKAVRVSIIIVVILLAVWIVRALTLYIGNYIPDRNRFGAEYKQITYPTSISDYFIAKKQLKIAEKALSTITTEENAKEQFGELGYLCITYGDSVTAKYKLKFIAARFSGSKGYIWVKYSSEGYDKDNELSSGSWKILSKWTYEKIGDEWVMVDWKDSL